MKKIEIDGKILNYDDKEDQSILEFLESKNIKMEAECRDGYCGACRCKLESGTVETSPDAIGFVADDEILICSSKPKGSIKISRKF